LGFAPAQYPCRLFQQLTVGECG